MIRSMKSVVLAVLLLLLPMGVGAQTVKYVHTDALGSVVAVTDASRNVIERREYEPYGAQLTPMVRDGPGYTGHVQDAATGLVYMQQRYYDPMLGLFLSVDPVTASGGDYRYFSRYRYVANNPYRFVDPDGRYICAADRPGCDRLEAAVGLTHEAAQSSSDPRVAQASQLLGKPREPNGVVVSGKLTDSRRLGEANSEDGKNIDIGLNFEALTNIEELASVLIHEASHGVDQRTLGLGERIRIRSRSAYETTEHRAAVMQARMFEALNRNEPFGLFRVDGGINWSGINGQMQNAVDSTCLEPSSCNP